MLGELIIVLGLLLISWLSAIIKSTSTSLCFILFSDGIIIPMTTYWGRTKSDHSSMLATETSGATSCYTQVANNGQVLDTTTMESSAYLNHRKMLMHDVIQGAASA